MTHQTALEVAVAALKINVPTSADALGSIYAHARTWNDAIDAALTEIRKLENKE